MMAICLQYFVAQGIPVLGIEPAENIAAAAATARYPDARAVFWRGTGETTRGARYAS